MVLPGLTVIGINDRIIQHWYVLFLPFIILRLITSKNLIKGATEAHRPSVTWQSDAFLGLLKGMYALFNAVFVLSVAFLKMHSFSIACFKLLMNIKK